MATRRFALILGIVYALVGIMGFIPGLVTPPQAGMPDLAVDAGHGLLLGIMPVNVVHNIVHLAIGLWGIVASRDFGAAKIFSRGTATIFGLLFVMGLIPGMNTMFGLAPIYGADTIIHLVTALAAGYFGFVAEQHFATPAV
jgi:hypothetical protein